MEVTLNGRRYTVTRETVERVLHQEPGPIKRYAVKIGDRLYPIKQAAGVGIGLAPVQFTSQHASQWLSRLGFEILDIQES